MASTIKRKALMEMARVHSFECGVDGTRIQCSGAGLLDFGTAQIVTAGLHEYGSFENAAKRTADWTL
jgi:hypothetical protein